MNRIRNNPTIAGVVLAVLAFIAAYLILPLFENSTKEQTLGLSMAIAAFAFYKGRRAVQIRLEADRDQ